MLRIFQEGVLKRPKHAARNRAARLLSVRKHRFRKPGVFAGRARLDPPLRR